MTRPELEPLLRKAEALRAYPEARDIHERIAKEAGGATNEFMARQVCRMVITMCHPKAWGDRFVAGFDSNLDWVAFLGELSDIANGIMVKSDWK